MRALNRTTVLRVGGFALLCSALGCASETGSASPEGGLGELGVSAELTLERPESGFQVEILGTMVESGEDAEWCEVVQLPGSMADVYHVDRMEAAMTPQAHDLVVTAAVPGSDTEANMEVGTRIRCQRAGEVFGEELEELMVSRHLYADVHYPEGIGKVLYGGQKLVVDHHYFNTSEQPVAAKTKLNFHLMPEGGVRQAARSATFNNLTIYTPPGGESSHLAECFVDEDVWVSTLRRYTHRWGTSFTVWLAGGDRDGERVWTSSQWDQFTSYGFADGAILLKAGEGFRFQCDYRNPTDEPIQFGSDATDEVCALHITYWNADETRSASDQSCLLFLVDEDGVARK